MAVQVTSPVIVALVEDDVAVQDVVGVPVHPANANAVSGDEAASPTVVPTSNVNVPQTVPAVGVGPVTEHAADWSGGEKPPPLVLMLTV